MMNQYTAQTTIRLAVTVTATIGGALTDPTTVTLSMRNPDHSIDDLTSAVVRDSVGVYHAEVTPTELGLHMYEWRGSGAVSVASIGQFLVTQSTF